MDLLRFASRNPLKSGQCFLLLTNMTEKELEEQIRGRNPLESGQCFLLVSEMKRKEVEKDVSQSPRIGSMFPTKEKERLLKENVKLRVAIPSNRVNVSYLN